MGESLTFLVFIENIVDALVYMDEDFFFILPSIAVVKATDEAEGKPGCSA